jgi:hypothetical protein
MMFEHMCITSIEALLMTQSTHVNYQQLQGTHHHCHYHCHARPVIRPCPCHEIRLLSSAHMPALRIKRNTYTQSHRDRHNESVSRDPPPIICAHASLKNQDKYIHTETDTTSLYHEIRLLSSAQMPALTITRNSHANKTHQRSCHGICFVSSAVVVINNK